MNTKSEGKSRSNKKDSKYSYDNDSVCDGSVGGSDMILQWAFKKNKLASNF